jgi:hypothetical protein
MPDDDDRPFVQAVKAFFAACPRYYELPPGPHRPFPPKEPFPSEADLALLAALTAEQPPSPDDVMAARNSLTRHQAYDLQIFACRMAILAARRAEPAVLRSGTFAMVLDDDRVDRRDVMVHLSIIEDCAKRVGTDLEPLVRDALALASKRRSSTISNYLSLPPERRGLRFSGYAAEGSGENLLYGRWP